jgi:excisionase family DNA binding protein
VATKTATRLLPILEAAQRLGCSDDHIYRLIAAGALSVVNIAQPGAQRSKSRIREDELARYIDAQTRNAKQLRAAG